MVTAMPNDGAHNSYWRTSDVVFGGPFLLAVALQFVVPLSLPQGHFRPVCIVVGAALSLAGLTLIVLARRELTRHSQPADPGHPTSQVVTSGVFAISRNPLYLGVVCVLAGIALAVNLPWVLVLLLPSLVLCHSVLIVPEERYLGAKLGAEYRTYAATVHRWLGRARRAH